jgi:hypothetical protein
MANVIAAQNDFYIANKWVPAHTPRRWFRLSKVLTGGGEREKEKGQEERAERSGVSGLQRYYKISVIEYRVFAKDIREEYERLVCRRATNSSVARDLAAIARQTYDESLSWMEGSRGSSS